MRDRAFVAVHRGGPLKREKQRHLILWSCSCVEHVLPLFPDVVDERLLQCLQTARDWAAGKASVGDARKASVKMLQLAREFKDPVAIAIVRAAGHAVATAHMADHSMGGAIYSLKAVKLAGKSVKEEREWQNAQLPPDIAKLVLKSRSLKELHFRDLKNEII